MYVFYFLIFKKWNSIAQLLLSLYRMLLFRILLYHLHILNVISEWWKITLLVAVGEKAHKMGKKMNRLYKDHYSTICCNLRRHSSENVSNMIINLERDLLFNFGQTLDIWCSQPEGGCGFSSCKLWPLHTNSKQNIGLKCSALKSFGYVFMLH